MIRPEQELHKAVCQYLTLVLPKSAYWTSLDHAGGGPMVGRFRKARGVKKGLPDILIIHEGRCSFIELKSEKGRLTPAQDECHEALVWAGANVAICKSINAVANCLAMWRIPSRDRASPQEKAAA